MSNYTERTAILLRLGFKSYWDYLQSDLWQSVREKVFQFLGRECCACRRFAHQVHHEKYTLENLIGKNLLHLKPICKECHRAIEMDGAGRKTQDPSVKLDARIHQFQDRVHQTKIRRTDRWLELKRMARDAKLAAKRRRKEERIRLEGKPPKPVRKSWQRAKGVKLDHHYRKKKHGQ